MKKRSKFMVIAFAIVSVGLGTYVSFGFKAGKTLDVLLNEIESFARYELPEVVIECGSSEKKGRCWMQTGCEPAYTPFGFFRVTECDRFTGYQSDSCYEDLPC